jgi:type 1 fimbria pilin
MKKYIMNHLSFLSFLKCNIAANLWVLLAVLYSPNIFAGVNMTVGYSGPLDYKGPADSVKIGEQIGAVWIAEGTQPGMCISPTPQGITHAYVSPISPPTNLTTIIDGISYTVFDTGTPGIGWVMSVKDRNGQPQPLMPTRNQWYPSQGTATNGRDTIGGTVKVTFVKTASHLETGVSVIPSQQFALITCLSQSGAQLDSAYILTPARQVTIQASGCVVQTPSSTTVGMGNYNAGNFPSVGSTSPAKGYTIQLSCDADVVLKATVSDQSNTANTSNIVSLTGDSVASGLGVQVFYNNGSTPLDLGPDNTSKGNLNQFDITSTVTSAQTVRVPFSFKYIRTGDIGAGKADALVGVTFSYQ